MRIKIIISMLSYITTLFSMEVIFNQPRHVVTFQFFDSKLVDNTSKSTLFHLDKKGRLTSSATGIQYILTQKHLTVLKNDWKEVTFSRWLQNDYLMQTSLQKKQNNYIRVTVDFDDIGKQLPCIFSYGYAIHNNSTATEMSNYFTTNIIPTAPETYSVEEENNEQKIAILEKGIIESYWCNSCGSYESNFAKVQLRDQQIILNNKEPYNDEGIVYQGSIDIEQKEFENILNWLVQQNVNEFFVRIKLANKIKITLLVYDIENQREKKKQEMEAVRLAKQREENRRFWTTTLFAVGITGCIIFVVWYMHKNFERYIQ